MQVLIPPPDIKKIIDVLSDKVKKNGQEFADMLAEKMKGDGKYAFLRDEENPYRPYYLKCLDGQQEIRNLIFEDESEQKSEKSDEEEVQIEAPDP